VLLHRLESSAATASSRGLLLKVSISTSIVLIEKLSCSKVFDQIKQMKRAVFQCASAVSSSAVPASA
jgi:hypothetical protein